MESARSPLGRLTAGGLAAQAESEPAEARLGAQGGEVLVLEHVALVVVAQIDRALRWRSASEQARL